jgi:hypothetical protein
VAVACLEDDASQIMLNWKRLKQICSRQVLAALADISHHWTIYISVFCQMPSGEQYAKSTEFTTTGMYLVANLADAIEATHADLVAQANPNHVIGSGWIAIPDRVELTEAQANAVFARMGAWNPRQYQEAS